MFDISAGWRALALPLLKKVKELHVDGREPLIGSKATREVAAVAPALGEGREYVFVVF